MDELRSLTPGILSSFEQKTVARRAAIFVKDGAPEVDVNQRPREFGAYRWILPEEFDLEWLPAFKRDVYRQVMMDFFGVKL